ncbi:hypothetical protein [Plantactinospora sonchi]|uniref:Uncharacterized protein n=1 Tax=Plantactinospora sonchi TaxID=1544735 RepID=A0ABU7S1U2_9ACTN
MAPGLVARLQPALVLLAFLVGTGATTLATGGVATARRRVN